MQKNLETNSPYKRLDDAATIKFLTSAASALVEGQLIGSHEAENLRLSLTSVNFGDLNDQTVLSQLSQQQDEFVSTLATRYSILGLWRNLLRFTWIARLSELQNALSEFGKSTLQTAQLQFNRPFTTYVNQNPDRRVIFAAVLVDYAEQLSQTCERLEAIKQNLGKLCPSDLSLPDLVEQEERIDRRFATELGLKHLTDDLIPFATEVSGRNDLIAALTTFFEVSRELIEQLQANRGREENSRLLVKFDSFQTLLQSLHGFSFPRFLEISSLEQRRLDFLSLHNEFHALVVSIRHELLSSLGKISTTEEDGDDMKMSSNVIRSLAAVMIREGTAATNAQQAANDLVKYCTKHNTVPEKILAAELPRINPHLSLAALQCLQDLERAKHVSASAGAEKQRTLLRWQRLQQAFMASAPTLSVLFFALSFAFTGCGVVGTPKSELIDYRPAVEYRNKPAKTGDKKPVEKKDSQTPTSPTDKGTPP